MINIKILFGKLIHVSPNNNLMINIFEIYWKSLDLSGMTFLSVSVYIFESEKQWASWNSLCSVLIYLADFQVKPVHLLRGCMTWCVPGILHPHYSSLKIDLQPENKIIKSLTYFIKIFSEIKKLMKIRKSLHSLNSYLL